MAKVKSAVFLMFNEEFEDTIRHKRRFLSIGFYALVDLSKINLVTYFFSDACEWKAIDELPELMMDHRLIFDKALDSLRKQLNYKPISFNLLSEKFTTLELQKLYEIILGKKLKRGNF